ncbi:hypothetical protein SARI_03491 [Salmonella enterica subsp. arizonae serovar 62:z4,z23:-]|uniref:Uncharacterized protein n=1 Tax=Salmonella arizonae (strain ATCC BAA-731 / CDC346-86 / RSK2980) TaxID=41514 RepID=A9MHD4_SALAR|nr:hypothetical protein SARI_03491 [Salmonella enterica subsp. arizonae serovar 62:z4,z23:-]
MHAVTVVNMPGKQKRILTANGDNNAGGDLRIVTFAAMAAQHCPFGFAPMHRVPAITAKFMRAIKFRQLYAAPRQLEQPCVLIDNLAYRSHIMTPMLQYQPDGIALPFAYPECALPHKIEICRRPVW